MKVTFQTRKLFTCTNEKKLQLHWSQREDGYDISMQFDNVPQESSDDQVNVDQELALKRSLRQKDPEQTE